MMKKQNFLEEESGGQVGRLPFMKMPLIKALGLWAQEFVFENGDFWS